MEEAWHCDAETLRALAQGTLAPTEAESTRLHLERCEQCSRLLGELDPLAGDTLARGPRKVSTAEVFLDSPARALLSGSRVDRYIILDRLAAGGMGEIYTAYDPQLDRKIALKLMRSDVLSTMGAHGSRASLLSEAKALARLSHPNVVAVHDVGELGEEIFIAMELVEGKVLPDWLDERPRTTVEVLEVFKMAGRGLAAAHAVGLVHRDFKPLNVIVGRDGRPRVVDFGLARTATATALPASPDQPPGAPEPRDTTASLSSLVSFSEVPATRGALSGTPAYMAPEQLVQEPTDARTDQFSFAVSLHEALCGRRPFHGASVTDLLAAIRRGLAPSSNEGAIPAWIHAVLARALSASREARYPTMDALLEALERDPTARRRQRWRMAASALAVAAGISLVGVARSQARRRCDLPGSSWAGVWDAGRRASLREAFARTGAPFAGAASDAVERALDRYRAEWLRMGRDACLARLDRALPREALEPRTACLDRRLSGARALMEQLSRADEAAVRNAARAVEDLQPLSDCEDEQALRAGAAWPLDPSRRAEVEAARARVAEARALHAVGSLPRALEVATHAAEAARATGYRPLVAEAELLVAQVQAQRHDIPRAIAAEHRAAAAAQATGQLELVVQAWTMLVRHSALQGDDAALWSSYAEAMLDRISSDTRALRAALLRSQAAAEVQRRHYERAQALARQSLALAEQVAGEDHPLVRDALGTIANASWYLGDLDMALAVQRRAAEVGLRVWGADHPAHAEHLRDLAGILIELGDPEGGLQHVDAAEAIFRRTMPSGGANLMMTTYYRILALGHLEARSGRSMGAEALARDSLRELEEGGGEVFEGYAPSITMALGIVLRLRGRCAEALPVLRRVEATFSAEAVIAADQWDAAELREHLGACLLATGDAARAREALEWSVRWFAENGTRNFLRAEGQFLLAQAQWRTGARTDARRNAESARALLQHLGPRGKALVPEVDRWLGGP